MVKDGNGSGWKCDGQTPLLGWCVRFKSVQRCQRDRASQRWWGYHRISWRNASTFSEPIARVPKWLKDATVELEIQA
jgi:hypothetical protein